MRDDRAREALGLVLSSILVKLSRRASDTSDHAVARRIAAGFPARFFVRKTVELAARLADMGDRMPKNRSALARILEGDARDLHAIDPQSIDLVPSRPHPTQETTTTSSTTPRAYAGCVYVLDPFARKEIGARRHLEPLGPKEGTARWRTEMVAVLGALGRVLRPQGQVVFLLANSVIAGAPVFAVDEMVDLAADVGLRIRAAVSQRRPHFHAASSRAFEARPRQEHALVITWR